MLSLSKNNILSIKTEKNINNSIKKSKYIKKCLFIKFILFFIISNLFLLFFWYFITCFFAVYINSQNIVIKNTFITFFLSMGYSFVLNLLYELFKISLLKAKNKKYFYLIFSRMALI